MTQKSILEKIPEIEISIKYKKEVHPTKRFQVKSAEDIAVFARALFNADTINWTEEVILICLNQSSSIMGYYKVSSGGISSAIVDPKVVFTFALNCCATKVILAHNHPSSNIKPSQADDRMTQQIKQGGEILGIDLLDHVIVTDDNGYYSYLENDQL